MELERIRFRTQLRFVLDSLLIILSFFLAYYIRKPFSGPPFQPLGPIDQYVWLLILSLPFWWLTLILSGVYSGSLDDIGRILRTVGKSGLIMLFILSFLFFIFNIGEINRTFVFLFTLLSSTSMILWRYLDARFGMDFEYKRLLVVGGGAKLPPLIRHILDDPLRRFELAGVLTDEVLQSDLGTPILGQSKDLSQILHDIHVDEVLFAMPFSDLESKDDLLYTCRLLGIKGMLMIDEKWIGDSKVDVGKMFDFPFLSLTTTAASEIDLLAKEVLDRTIGFVLIAILSPALILIALLIKLTSPGPAFFIQERSGRNGRRFKMYKFRTMTMDAPERKAEIQQLNEMSGPVFKLKNDPRITRIGKVLRKYSLDEFPQLFNVLRGDMSLVGPRPLPCEEAAQIKRAHRRRLSVRPGMTGIWQISGRNDIPYEEWMKLDLKYVDEWSLELDFKILLKTPAAVISSKGAH